MVEKQGLTLDQLLVSRDPFRGWPCGRSCVICSAKPEHNTQANCNLQNCTYVGICVDCEEEELERLKEDGIIDEEEIKKKMIL